MINLLIDLELCTLKLINFDCSFNRIICLPLNLREMNSLIELNVDHNPLETPPASVRQIISSSKTKIHESGFRFVLLVYFISCVFFLSKP